MNIEKALSMAWHEARKQAEYHQSKIGQKPDFGGTQEDHDAYHAKYAKQAIDAKNWLHTRMRQYNPD